MTAGPQLVSACRNDATPVSNIGSLGAVLATVRHQSGAAHQSSSGRPKGWEQLQQDGHRVNPCNSPNHPAVVQGVLPTPEGDELSVQVRAREGFRGTGKIIVRTAWSYPGGGLLRPQLHPSEAEAPRDRRCACRAKAAAGRRQQAQRATCSVLRA